MVEIGTAHAADADHVFRLLNENLLTTDGLLHDRNTVLVARLEERIVGTATLEIHDDGALLRSLVVSSDFRGRGLGARLIESALRIAEDGNVRDIYLLTFTAENYFQRFGFRLVNRDEVPAAVRRSVQFTRACSPDALVMCKQCEQRPEGRC